MGSIPTRGRIFCGTLPSFVDLHTDDSGVWEVRGPAPERWSGCEESESLACNSKGGTGRLRPELIK